MAAERSDPSRPERTARRRAATVALVAVAVLAATLAGPGPVAATVPAAAGPPGEVQAQQIDVGNPRVMRASRVSAAQLAAWYRARTPVAYRATVGVGTLARYFIEEGRAEGVAGDLAFVQSIVETGWFGFSGRVPPSANNFAGIGATDSTQAYNTFRSARIGVRAQIQHLRAYADPTVTPARLAHPLESPRFHLVQPKGKAPTWRDMGNGNWATDPQYATKILNLYADLLVHAEVSSFPDVPRGTYYSRPVAWMEREGITDGVGNTGRYQPAANITRAEVATMLWRMLGRPRPARPHGFPDVPTGSFYDRAVAYLRAAGVTDGVGNTGRFVPARSVTRAEMVTFLWRIAGSPQPRSRHRFPDVPAGSWYDTAVSWAARHSITDGVGDTGRFQPLDPVTRAQMAAFMHRLVLRPAAWRAPLPPTAP